MSTPALALDDLLPPDALRVFKNYYSPGDFQIMSQLAELAYQRGYTEGLRKARLTLTEERE
jgi:hypothetical protein